MLARQWGLVCHSFRSKNKALFACMTALTPEGERSDVIKSYDASVRLTLAPAQPCIHPDFPSIHPSSSHPRYPSRLIIILPSSTVTLLVLFPSISRLQHSTHLYTSRFHPRCSLSITAVFFFQKATQHSDCVITTTQQQQPN